jgi:uncharacterized membrane-anchored protein
VNRIVVAVCCTVVAWLGIAGVRAEEPRGNTPAPVEPKVIPWKVGPLTGDLGKRAELRVPKGMLFTDVAGTMDLLRMTQNIPTGNEVGSVAEEFDGGAWFAIFEFEDVGYVSDEEKNSIDANALLQTMMEGNRKGNEERRARGWETLELIGWIRPPYYDVKTNNLTWSTRARSADGHETVNHNVRILGRDGVMQVTLVASPEEMEVALPAFNSMLSGFSYNQGFRYAEYKKGDRLAGYGLTALIAGGAAAAAVKTGLLQKFWKLIVAALVAGAAGLRKLFGSSRGEASPVTAEGPPPPPPENTPIG